MISLSKAFDLPGPFENENPPVMVAFISLANNNPLHYSAPIANIFHLLGKEFPTQALG